MTSILKEVLRDQVRQGFKKAVDKNYDKRKGWSKKLVKLNKDLSAASGDDRKKIQSSIVSLMTALDRTAKLSYVKYHKKCRITGRSRGLKFDICRGQVRHYASFGMMSGVVKS